MKSRHYYFTEKLPFGLGQMVCDAYVYIKKSNGFSDEDIHRKLYDEDVTNEFDHRTASETLCGAFTWMDSKEDHEFWEEIYNKLKQIEQR